MSNFTKIDLPVVDLKGIFSESRQDFEKTAKDLFEASEICGVVLLENHGVCLENIDKLSSVGDHFFDLPLDKKMKYSRTQKPFHGYCKDCKDVEGESIIMNESYDIHDMAFIFPEEVPDLRKASQVVYDEFNSLRKRMLKLLDIAFESGEFFQNNYERKTNDDFTCGMKILRYPEVDPRIPVGTIRLTEHSDFPCLTFLHTVEGLQIKPSDDDWKTVNIPPNALILQYGLSLQRMSSDRLKAVRHRVIVTENEKLRPSPRRVFVFFQGLHDEAILRALDGSNKYPPISTKDFIIQGIENFYQQY